MDKRIEEQQNELQAKRDATAKRVVELQSWLGKNSKHYHYERKKKEWNEAMEELRAINAINKNRGHEQEIMLGRVVKDCIGAEQYNRIKSEAISRMDGNEPKIISILKTSDEEIIEKYKPLEKKYNVLLSKIREFPKELDSMMLSTAGAHSPEQWNNIQNYNKQILKIKREINKLLEI